MGIRRTTFAPYLYKLVRAEDARISSKSMAVMDSLADDLLERIVIEATKLMRYNKRETLVARDIVSAAHIVLGGELGTHALIHVTRAVNNYEASFGGAPTNMKTLASM